MPKSAMKSLRPSKETRPPQVASYRSASALVAPSQGVSALASMRAAAVAVAPSPSNFAMSPSRARRHAFHMEGKHRHQP